MRENAGDRVEIVKLGKPISQMEVSVLPHLRAKETESNGGVKAGEGDETTNLRRGFLIDEEEDDRWRRLAACASKGWSFCREKEETMTQGLRREETTCLPRAL